MIPPWQNHFGKRTALSLIYFLNYAYLEIGPSLLFFYSPSSCWGYVCEAQKGGWRKEPVEVAGGEALARTWRGVERRRCRRRSVRLCARRLSSLPTATGSPSPTSPAPCCPWPCGLLWERLPTSAPHSGLYFFHNCPETMRHLFLFTFWTTVQSVAVACLVSSTFSDFQKAYEGEIWCLCTVTLGHEYPKLNSRRVYCSWLYSKSMIREMIRLEISVRG